MWHYTHVHYPGSGHSIADRHAELEEPAVSLLFWPVMDHSPIRQTFKFENNFSTAGKSVLNLAKRLVVKYCEMSKI